MSAEAAIVASDTGPVAEVIEHDVHGRLVDFFEADALVAQVCELLQDEAARRRLGRAARKRVEAQYDLRAVCLPQQLAWVDRVMRDE